MMSVMCSNALTKRVKELGLTKPGEILDATTKIIEGRFEISEQMVLDGMDLALCKLNLKTLQQEYAIIRNAEVLETKADKQPIGICVLSEALCQSENRITKTGFYLHILRRLC